MYHNPDSLVRLKKNLEEMRPGKRPCPQRSWHYISNLEQNFTVRSRAVNLYPNHTPKAASRRPTLSDLQNSRTLRELNELKKQLQLEGSQLKSLQQDLARRSGVRLTFRRDTHSLSPSNQHQKHFRLSSPHKTSGKVFHVPSVPLKYTEGLSPAAKQIYFPNSYRG